MANRSSLVVGYFLNSCNLSAKSKSKFKSSDSSKALADAESKLMQSANAKLNVSFLVRHQHNETLDFSVISTEGNSFRLLHEDDDDLPRNLLSVLGIGNYVYDVFGCCGSWIWLIYRQIGSTSQPQNLLWDMETDTCRFICPPTDLPNFDDCAWAHGFGFDPSSGHYKLVRCWMDHFGEKKAEVFSLGSSSWKDVHCPYGIHLRRSGFRSIHINGFHYWIVRECVTGVYTIMSFDFANDQFHALIPLPKKEKLCKLVKVAIVEFEGSLGAIYFDSKVNTFFEIWAWNARGSFWSLVATFDIPAAAAPRAVLNLYNNDKLFLADTKGDLMLYDHATRRLENFWIPIDRRGFAQFYPYIGSSVCPSSSVNMQKI